MAKLYYSPTKNAVQKTLSAELLVGATASASLSDVDGIPNSPGIMVIDRVDANGTATASKREYIAYSGTSGSTVVTLTRNVDGGGTDQTHAVGAVVEFVPDVTWAGSIQDAIATLVTTADTTVVNTTNVVTPTGTQTLTNKTINGGTLASVSLISPSGLPMTDAGAFVYPTGLEKYRALATSASVSSVDYIEMEHNATDSLINSGKGHITITPASNKLVKIAVLEQAHNSSTTNTYRNNSIVLTGWVNAVGGANSGLFTVVGVTMGLTFATQPIILVSSSGRDTTGVRPTTLAAHDELQGYLTCDVYGMSTSVFTVAWSACAKGDGTTTSMSSGAYYAATWIAIGTL